MPRTADQSLEIRKALRRVGVSRWHTEIRKPDFLPAMCKLTRVKYDAKLQNDDDRVRRCCLGVPSPVAVRLQALTMNLDTLKRFDDAI